MNREFFRQNSRIIGLAVGVVLVIVLVFFLVSGGNASVRIFSDEGATISVSAIQEGEFKEIGTSEATYSGDSDSPVYIKAELGNQVSYGGVVLEGGKKIEYELFTQPQLTDNVQKFFDGPLKSLYVEGDEAFGIAPSSDKIVNVGVDSFIPPKSSFVTIPPAEKVIWENSNRFIGTFFARGVKAFVDGRDVFSGSSLLPEFQAVDRYQNGDYYLLSNSGLYSVSRLSGAPTKLADLDFQNRILDVFADAESVYAVSQPFPGEFTESVETFFGPKEEEIPPITNIIEFSADGSVVEEFEVIADSVSDVRRVGSNLVLTTSDGLIIGESEFPSYFDHNNDVVSFGDTMYILNHDGVWEVSQNNGALNKIISFGDGLIGLSGSLQTTEQGLRYGVVPDKDSSAVGSIYTLDF